MTDEYDKAFDEWYHDADNAPILDGLTLKEMIRKAYFAGAAMGTEKALELLENNRQAG